MFTKKNMLLLLCAAIIVFLPILINGNIEYSGTDDAAVEMISTMRPDYHPWFENIWEPSTDKMEKLLFILQGTIGGGFMIYYFRHHTSKKKVAR